ncbi:sodium-dependent dicarboxylate transporter 2/3/5 [Litorivivens lipolytica]|uniref:Sodium-dependent dicarboxylate transporter 2/3/5 n=1 Tax=Litorivivens lipolytica TaxID=1524264 RepID=A0A7W4W5M6_9GAMM|nr:SLC13 family permease [Litorivivens lipolytica]MBB3047277.1 sodium-dependent dicarboxylate transporter 2/3/5 [Litorivivens lipolytica]
MKAIPWRLASGPLLAALSVLVGSFTGLEQPALVTLTVTAFCLGWWFAEAVPIAVTAMIPLAVFPLFGVLSSREVAEAYGASIVLLMLGGFLLSRAMAYRGTHYHLALMALHWVGAGSERRLIVGFMLASAMLSMWISNTATTLMLLPVALAILDRLQRPSLAVPLLLGIAYAASIGGIATPIGTPPNLVFMQVYTELTGEEISFLGWMRWGLPVVVLFLPVAMWRLSRGLRSSLSAGLPDREPWDIAQKRVLWVFLATALLWITRSEPFGGWSGLLNLPGANDATIALLAGASLFAIGDGKGGRLLDWEATRELPWGILILFGGGICIAKAFAASGLSEQVAGAVTALAHWPVLLLLVVLCLSVTFLTEATSNMATATLLMPILGAAALGLGLPPALLMVPAAISASCAFTLPIATAPNAIVYGSGLIRVPDMARRGIVLSIFGALIVALLSFVLIH